MDGELINAKLALLLATFRFIVFDILYVHAGWRERKMLYFENFLIVYEEDKGGLKTLLLFLSKAVLNFGTILNY